MTKVGEEKLGCFKNNQSNGLYSFSSVSIRKPCLYLKYVDINFSPGISYSKGPFKKVHTLGWGGGGGDGFTTDRTKTNIWMGVGYCSNERLF